MIAGSMVALVTPFDAQGRLDWDSLAKLVDFHLQEGTNAIVAVGTTGESATLDVEEHIQVIRRVVDQVKGRIPVIAGTGANSTREAVALTEAAKSGGGLEPNLAQNIEMQAMSAVQHQEAMGAPTVLLVNHSLRLILSRFLRRSLPQLAVMSNLELNDRRQIRMTSMIGG